MVNAELAGRLTLPNPYGYAAVVIFHHKANPPAWLLCLIDERVPLRVEHDRDRWLATDFVVFNTGGLTVRRERLAARLGALPVILPAAADWLAVEIPKRLAQGTDVAVFIPYPGCEDVR